MCRFADPAADMHDSVFRLFVSSCSTDLRVRLLRLLSRKELEEDEAAERSNLRTHFGESLPDVPLLSSRQQHCMKTCSLDQFWHWEGRELIAFFSNAAKLLTRGFAHATFPSRRTDADLDCT